MNTIITEKELHDMGNCDGLGCAQCPFLRKRDMKVLSNIFGTKPLTGNYIGHVCYGVFKKYYEKQLVIEEVLKSE